jgi:hypothetical protein
MHLILSRSYARYREDGSIIGVYGSLYVFTALDGDWRIQCRSSFGLAVSNPSSSRTNAHFLIPSFVLPVCSNFT